MVHTTDGKQELSPSPSHSINGWTPTPTPLEPPAPLAQNFKPASRTTLGQLLCVQGITQLNFCPFCFSLQRFSLAPNSRSRQWKWLAFSSMTTRSSRPSPPSWAFITSTSRRHSTSRKPFAKSVPISSTCCSPIYMPAAGDGLTVVSAMRPRQPQAVTLLLSAFPAIRALPGNRSSGRRCAGEILDAGVGRLIRQRLAASPHRPRPVESLASLLGRSTQTVTDRWYRRIQTQESVTISLTREQRCAHLPH